MLRKFIYNRIFRTTGMLLLLLLLLLFPASKEYSLEDEKITKLVMSETSKKEVYLLDRNGYVSRCHININYSNTKDAAKKLIEILIQDGKYEDKIPNGFKAILPPDTIINNVYIENNNITIDLSKDILELKEDNFKKMLQLVTYNLTTLDNIKNVYIKVNNKLLDNYNNKIITQPFKRSDGVNNEYNEINYKNISKTTIYYVCKNNNKNYYVPVTKINNSNEDKIKIIINELASSNIYETNLMSFLNYNTKLNNYEINDKEMIIDFNNYLFDDINSKTILEEVIYTISLSVRDNYDINTVVFKVNGKEITKSVLKDIE